MVRFPGLANSNMLSKISREPRELPWQQIWAKISQNCLNFNSVQEIKEFSACIVGFTGLVNSNMLAEFSRELRELRRQPNLGKNKPKLHKF